jgi:hypothetical protein
MLNIKYHPLHCTEITGRLFTVQIVYNRSQAYGRVGLKGDRWPIDPRGLRKHIIGHVTPITSKNMVNTVELL